MPFQSEKQRRYLHANHPEIAKRWERDYANGGITRIPLKKGSYSRSYNPGAGGVVQHGPVKTKTHHHGGNGGDGPKEPPSIIKKPTGPTPAEIAAAKAKAEAEKRRLEAEARKKHLTNFKKTQKSKIKKFEDLVKTKGYYDSTIASDEEKKLYDDWMTATGTKEKIGNPTLINSESIEDFREKDGKSKTFITDKSSFEDLLTGDINKETTIVTPDLGTISTFMGPEGIQVHTGGDKYGTIENFPLSATQSWAVNPGKPQDDDFSDIQGQQAVLGKLPLIQMRTLEKKVKAPEIYGKPTEKEIRMYEKLLEMDKEEKVYKMPILTAAKGGVARKNYYHGGILDITGEEEITTEEGNDISLVDESETGVSTLFRAKDGGTPRRRYFTGAYGGGNPNEDRAAEESHANEFAGIDSGGWDPGVSSPGTTSTGGNVNQPNIGPSLHGGPSVKETLDALKEKQHEEAVNTEFEDTVDLPFALDLHGVTPSKNQRIAIHNRNIKAKKENYEKALAEQRKKMTNMGLMKLVVPGIMLAAGMPFKYALKGITVSPKDVMTAVKYGVPVTKAKKEYVAALENAKGVILSDVDIHNPNEMRNLEETTNFREIMDDLEELTRVKDEDEDTKGDTPEVPVVAPITEEIEDSYAMAGNWLQTYRDLKAKQALAAQLQEKWADEREWQQNTMFANSGGLANLFRVKN